VLKLNDIYRPDMAKFMHKLHHGVSPKIYDNYFQNICSWNWTETRL